MQASELIKELPKGILKWYPFDCEKKILVIDENNIFGIQYMEEKYTYIIVTSVIEKMDTIDIILEQLKNLLETNGRLFLLMNNRLGIRYFCGDRDPYTMRNFDSIEDYTKIYCKKEDNFYGRMYDKTQITKLLKGGGFEYFQFYSVFTDLDNPSFIFSEDYVPNEDLANRIFPTYNHADTVFMEEEKLYQQLIDNGMFHQMANAYLIECSLDGGLSDINFVTSSLERGRKDALFTMIHKSGIVEKKAAYPEGRERIREIHQNGENLQKRGIKVVENKLEQDSCVMPFVEAKVGQQYLKELILTDKEKFLQKFDYLKELVLKSSEIIEPDKGDGNGALLKYAYLDMVPLNSFYMNDDFVFFDQEFCKENYPANVVIYRLICTFYAGNGELQKIVPVQEMYERYDLNRKLERWRTLEREFMIELRKEKELRIYHERIRRNAAVVNENRHRMNYSESEYNRFFGDIFKNADSRKLILFGSGNFAKKFLDMYQTEYPVYAIIDNNENKWGSELEGIRIDSVHILDEWEPDDYKVLICIKNYLPVMKQLDKLGVKDYSVFNPEKTYQRPMKVVLENNGEITKKKYHIGYVAGVFDMFHVGHINLLRKAKELCDYLIVGVLSDEGVFLQKNKYPIIAEEDRVEVLRACKYVDRAEILPAERAGIREAYKLFHFDVQFSGDDHGEDLNWMAEKAFLQKNGADIVFFSYTEGISSTQIRKKLKEKKENESHI